MAFFPELRARLRRRRRIKAAKALKTPLREFVYLDEVSVYSMLASREGALPAEYTHTRTDSVSSELEGRIRADAAVLKADVSSKVGSERAESIQVLRKYTVQAAFKEFHEGEEDRLAVSPISSEATAPAIDTWEQLRQALDSSKLDGWVIYPERFERGHLIELEIELRAEPIFEFTSIITTMQDFMKDAPELFEGAEYPYEQIAAGNRILSKLLVGLIPIRCLSVDYKVANFGHRNVLVHRQLLDRLPVDPNWPLRPLWVVGVTEERFFWKDVRQVLFSSLRFRTLCRINDAGLQGEWVPVKLVNLLGRIAPGLADQIRDVSQIISSPDLTKAASLDSYGLRLQAALVSYGVSLAEYCGQAADTGELATVAVEAIANASRQGAADDKNTEGRRELFEVITDYIAKLFSIAPAPDSVVIARLRWAALQEAGLVPDTSGSQQSSVVGASQANVTADSMLDAEIVAIYW